MARWKLTEKAAWARALSNVKARVGSLTLVHLRSEEGPSGIAAGSGLAPSILAEPETCGPATPAGLVVLLYARDMFLISAPDHSVDFERFVKMARDEIAARRSLSSTMLVCRGGRWKVATP